MTTVPNPKPLAPNVQKLHNRKVSISSYIFYVFWGVFGVFVGVGVVRFFSKFRIQSRMILVNTIPNPKSVAPKLQKLQSRKVPIIGGHRQQLRHQSGKTYSLVEMKFRRDKKA